VLLPLVEETAEFFLPPTAFCRLLLSRHSPLAALQQRNLLFERRDLFFDGQVGSWPWEVRISARCFLLAVIFLFFDSFFITVLSSKGFEMGFERLVGGRLLPLF